MRAYGLLRVSTDAQVEKGFSLADQERAIREHCQARGYELVELLQDAGVRGWIRGRESLRRLLDDADAKAYQVLVIANVDRFGRRSDIISGTMARLRERRIKIDVVGMHLGDKPADRFLLNTLGNVAELDNEQRRLRMMECKLQKADQGKMPIRFITYGYRCIEKWEEHLPGMAGRAGTLEIVEDEARLVREIFERYDAGATMREIVRWLEAAGHRTRRGGVWSKSTIDKFLLNETYAGRAYYNRFETIRYEDEERPGKIRVSETERPRSEWRLIPCPAIVDEALFQRVQTRLKQNREQLSGRPPAQAWALKGVVLNTTCLRADGAPRSMLRHDRNRWFGMRCPCRGTPGVAPCGLILPRRPLEKDVRQWLERQLRGNSMPSEAKRRVKAAQSDVAELRKTRDRAHAELERIAAMEMKLLDEQLTGRFSQAVIDTKLAELRTRQTRAVSDFTRAEAALQRQGDPNRAAAQAERLAGEWLEKLLSAGDDAAALNAIYRSLIVVEVGEGGALTRRFREEVWDACDGRE